MNASKGNVFVDLWPVGSWNESDLQEVMQMLNPFGSTSGRVSDDTRGMELQTLIAFASGAIATGFFERIGADVSGLLTNLVRFLLKKFKTPDERTQDLPIGRNGLLTVAYDYPREGVHISFSCHYSTRTELERFFTSLKSANQQITSRISNREFPFDKPSQFSVMATAQLEQAVSWQLRVSRSNYEGNKFISSESFKGSLSGTAWERI